MENDSVQAYAMGVQTGSIPAAPLAAAMALASARCMVTKYVHVEAFISTTCLGPCTHTYVVSRSDPQNSHLSWPEGHGLLIRHSLPTPLSDPRVFCQLGWGPLEMSPDVAAKSPKAITLETIFFLDGAGNNFLADHYLPVYVAPGHDCVHKPSRKGRGRPWCLG